MSAATLSSKLQPTGPVDISPHDGLCIIPGGGLAWKWRLTGATVTMV